jgi:hypothetical protein
MLFRHYEIEQFKLEPTYKPKALRDIKYPSQPKNYNEKKLQAQKSQCIADIDRLDEAVEEG